MNVQKIDNQSLTTISQIAIPALTGGVLAQYCQELTLPAEIKAALKNSRLSQDKFVAKSVKLAKKSLKKIEKTQASEKAVKIAKGLPIVNMDCSKIKIDMEKVAVNAKEMYPKFKETAKIARKSLNKTLFGTIALIAGIKMVSMFVKKLKKIKDITQVATSTTA